MTNILKIILGIIICITIIAVLIMASGIVKDVKEAMNPNKVKTKDIIKSIDGARTSNEEVITSVDNVIETTDNIISSSNTNANDRVNNLEDSGIIIKKEKQTKRK